MKGKRDHFSLQKCPHALNSDDLISRRDGLRTVAAGTMAGILAAGRNATANERNGVNSRAPIDDWRALLEREQYQEASDKALHFLKTAIIRHADGMKLRNTAAARKIYAPIDHTQWNDMKIAMRVRKYAQSKMRGGNNIEYGNDTPDDLLRYPHIDPHTHEEYVQEGKVTIRFALNLSFDFPLVDHALQHVGKVAPRHPFGGARSGDHALSRGTDNSFSAQASMCMKFLKKMGLLPNEQTDRIYGNNYVVVCDIPRGSTDVLAMLRTLTILTPHISMIQLGDTNRPQTYTREIPDGDENFFKNLQLLQFLTNVRIGPRHDFEDRRTNITISEDRTSFTATAYHDPTPPAPYGHGEDTVDVMHSPDQWASTIPVTLLQRDDLTTDYLVDGEAAQYAEVLHEICRLQQVGKHMEAAARAAMTLPRLHTNHRYDRREDYAVQSTRDHPARLQRLRYCNALRKVYSRSISKIAEDGGYTHSISKNIIQPVAGSFRYGDKQMAVKPHPDAYLPKYLRD